LGICTGDFLLDGIAIKIKKLEGIRLISILDHDFGIVIVCTVKEGTCGIVAYATRAGGGLIGQIFFTLPLTDGIIDVRILIDSECCVR
jgi:hypothetical protein